MATARVIGAGPNGLAAAIVLARAGVRVTVYEAMERVGGACGTEELTLPGFRHDVGAAVFPMGLASPFLRTLPLEQHGVRWVQPAAPLAHPLDDGTAVMLERGVFETADGLGEDGAAYRRMMEPLVSGWSGLVGEILQPLLHVPRHPLALARFGAMGLLPATALAKMSFKGERARALFAGNAAHSVMPLTKASTAAVGLTLHGAAHGEGWPVVEGGSQALVEAMASILRGLGGEIRLGVRVERLGDLEPADRTLCDVTPRQFLRMTDVPVGMRRRLEGWRYGPGAFKIDYALSEPIPWRAKECRRAATVHLGGSFEEIVASEEAAWTGRMDGPPFCLLVQPSLFDPTRAPAGKHTAWVYCHVPNGSGLDWSRQIEAQIERFAPGFRECVLARRTQTTTQMEAWNPNLVGGDVSGGAMSLGQIAFRPTARTYGTGVKGTYLCSASTPPGGGVHGMCGYWAAMRALETL
ncbi:Phytoene dehydrogenase-related protein [Granulicella pectinivorans]|uniref:Pyridine nucleotide-disulfide oxidoreductase domain-containing protein 2 n=1 Tax=Granulicella pectinivorans TaxID=474950 RepID=A0A1I6LKI5_9BACT|nr:NAD(P)/FAD-dependent oxidoreductase [Granulicella pectinivorans]SFS03891.1 Phytoene dehydrogenase-related protein [Granulicella pectinivorans]